MSLKERYANDPELQEFYKKNLLEPEWAGELHGDEFDYVKSQLQRSCSLKRKWGFRPSAQRIPEKHIRAVARDGIRAIQRSVLASAVEAEKTDKGDRYWREEALLHTDRRTGPGNQWNLRNGDREPSQRPTASLTDIQGSDGGKKNRRCLPSLFC